MDFKLDQVMGNVDFNFGSNLWEFVSMWKYISDCVHGLDTFAICMDGGQSLRQFVNARYKRRRKIDLEHTSALMESKICKRV